jgi:hypothetical protein
MTDPSRLIRDWMEESDLPESFYDPVARACTLPVGGGTELAVFSVPDGDDVFIAVDLLPVVHRSAKAELFALCMAMNAFAMQTRGGAVGFDAEREKIVLTYRISSSLLDPTILARIIENLLDAATGLRRRLSDLQHAADAGLDAVATRNDPVVMRG